MCNFIEEKIDEKKYNELYKYIWPRKTYLV